MSKLRYTGPARSISTTREILTDRMLLWGFFVMAVVFVFIVFVMGW